MYSTEFISRPKSERESDFHRRNSSLLEIFIQKVFYKLYIFHTKICPTSDSLMEKRN